MERDLLVCHQLELRPAGGEALERKLRRELAPTQ
jgi:hypothetical protein